MLEHQIAMAVVLGMTSLVFIAAFIAISYVLADGDINEPTPTEEPYYEDYVVWFRKVWNKLPFKKLKAR